MRRSGLICAARSFFFFNDTATTEIYTLSLHDALPIYHARRSHGAAGRGTERDRPLPGRSEEHTSELQSRRDLVCRLLLEKKNNSYELLQWLQERGADCLVIAEEERLLELATVAVPLKLPTFSTAITHGGGARAVGSNPSQDIHTTIAELLAPMPYILPGQLLAHYLALHKGLNPDQPRGLTKITRTR